MADTLQRPVLVFPGNCVEQKRFSCFRFLFRIIRNDCLRFLSTMTTNDEVFFLDNSLQMCSIASLKRTKMVVYWCTIVCTRFMTVIQFYQ